MILGLNLKEATQVADVLGLPDRADREATIEQDAVEIRRALGLACVVIHPRKAAAAATETESAALPRPVRPAPQDQHRSRRPLQRRLLPGPHFRDEASRKASAPGSPPAAITSDSAQSPSALELAGFIEELPAPEGW